MASSSSTTIRSLDFGVSLTEVNNRSAFANVQSDNTWGGVPGITPTLYPDDVWQHNTVRHFFDQISGSGNPNLFNDSSPSTSGTSASSWPMRVALAGRHRDLPAQRQQRSAGAVLRGVHVWGTDRRTEEESQSAYVQYSQTLGDGGADPHGARCALRADGRHLERAGADRHRHQLDRQQRVLPCSSAHPTSRRSRVTTSYVLPSVDFAFDLRDNLKLRASVGKSIGRPGWGDIQGGQTLSNLARIDGGTGAAGQSRPEAARIDATTICRSSGTTARAAMCRWAISGRTSTTTSASRSSRRQPFDLPHPGPGAAYYDEAARQIARRPISPASATSS